MKASQVRIGIDERGEEEKRKSIVWSLSLCMAFWDGIYFFLR